MLAPLWVVTFGDLISLLVTFFILLYTFSAVDQDDMRRVQGSLTGALGVVTDPGKKSKANLEKTHVPLTVRTDLRGSETLPKRSEIEELINDKIQDPSVFDQKVDMEGLKDGLRIRLDGNHFFKPGRTTLDPVGKEVLLEIGRMFKEEPVRLVVEAHTDPMTSTVGDTDPRTHTQIIARVMAQALVRDGDWDPSRVGASAKGASVPVAGNDTEIGRRKNRRIEIQVIYGLRGKGRL